MTADLVFFFSDFEFHFIWTVLRNHGATAARTRDQRMVKKDGMETVSGYTLYHNVCLRTYQLVLFIDDDDNIVRIVFVMI